jgi:hypothetical protein
MLLTWLAHALTLVRRDPPSASSHLCGQIVHRVFGEMYNMKAIAEMLVRMPLTDEQAADDPRSDTLSQGHEASGPGCR